MAVADSRTLSQESVHHEPLKEDEQSNTSVLMALSFCETRRREVKIISHIMTHDEIKMINVLLQRSSVGSFFEILACLNYTHQNFQNICITIFIAQTASILDDQRVVHNVFSFRLQLLHPVLRESQLRPAV